MSKKFLATPKPAPELAIPQSDKFVKVSIIDRYEHNHQYPHVCEIMSRVAITMPNSFHVVDESAESR